MPVSTYPHIIEAVRNAAKKGGRTISLDLAADMEMKVTSLGNLLNPYAGRNVVKLGLEQFLHILKWSGDHAALHLLVSELGYALMPLYAAPDKDTPERELLDDQQAGAEYSAAGLDPAVPDEIRSRKLAEYIVELIQSETSIRESRGQVFVPGKGWVKVEIKQ